VNSLNYINFTPSPEIILPGDIDIPPLQVVQTNGTRLVGAEDLAAGTDLNGNGLLDDALTQDTLIFKEGINQQLITIANSGYGIIDWYATESIAWLALDGSDTVQGVTATEFDYLTVTVDRTGLLPGTYTNTFQLSAGNLTRTIRAILKVPAVDGDWRGYAATVRVNGQPISLGKVDLNMTVFSKTTNITEKNIQAVINRELSLLFPRDVFMNGTFYQDNDFFLTTNFEVPTGDRNAPPFEVFANGNSGGNTNWSRDIDLNGDGKLDNSNPFPFPLRREITLIGRRVNENQLVGSYYESIQNVLPGQRINIEGEFQLDRISLTPTLTSIYNRYVPTNVIIGAASPAALTNTINVLPSVTVQGVVVTVNLDFALGSGVTVTLVPPTTNTPPVVLDTQAFSGTRTYTLDDFNGINGQGAWKLIVRWTPNGERGYFQGWQLNVQGLAVYEATGAVATGTTNSPVFVDGARVTLTGNNFVDQRFTATNGAFTFTNLTENDFTLTVSKVGYQDAQTGFSVIASNVSLGNIFLQPVTNTEAELLTLPYAGGEPLTVNFRTIVPLNLLSNLGTITNNTWTFGDGTSTNFVSNLVAEVEHTYFTPGYYTATNEIRGTVSSLTLVSRLITVFPASVPAGWTNAHFISAVGFIGSIGSSVQEMVNGLETPAPATTNVTVTVNGVDVVLSNVPTAALWQESKRDAAGFDNDRFPTGNFAGSEDTDVFPIGGGYQQFPRLATVGNSTNRFRMTTTMGGYVFGPERQPPDPGFNYGTNTAVYGSEPAKVGIFVLQPGRLEP
jgi:subtilisin-like proprotein convertase family protein